MQRAHSLNARTNLPRNTGVSTIHRFQVHRADTVGPGIRMRTREREGNTGVSLSIVFLLLLGGMVPLIGTSMAFQTNYSGNDPLGFNTTMDGNHLSVLSSGFNVPANATITGGWMNVSNDWDIDGGNGTWFESGVANRSLDMGVNDFTSTSHFDGKISLAPDRNVGWVDDFEDLKLQFTGFTASSDIWMVSDLNISAANGSLPNSIPEGILLAAATKAGGLPAGTKEWLQLDSVDLPTVVNNYSLHFEHWLNVDVNDGAWVEARLDNGSWNKIQPIGGHSQNLSNGTPAYVGLNASAWSHAEYSLDHQLGLNALQNASTISFRFHISTTEQSMERPGWFIDAINLTNTGEPSNSWFHGNLNGAYAANADGAITILANTSGMTSPMELEMWVDWDIEGNNNDNLMVEASIDGSNWSLISAPPGIPGSGVFVDGVWFYAESNGFKQIMMPVSHIFTNKSQVWFRFRVYTDSQVNGGYGISGWEGVYLDDPTLHSNIQMPNHQMLLLDNFSSNNSVTTSSPSGSVQQWQHVTNHGHNGPTWTAFGFEDSPLWPDGWSVEIETGNRGWAFGQYPGHGPMTGFPSGSNGAGIEFSGKYLPNMWTHLISPEMHIPGNASARLAFQHWMCAEPNWDGGTVYVSTDDGNTWTHFGQNSNNFYDTNSTVNPNSPLHLKGIFDGSLVPSGCFNAHPFSIKRADVSHLAGQDVRFRFSFFSDTYVEEWGWYLDDVGIEVDYFESRGNWTSPLIHADEWGYGLLDIRGSIPAGTTVTATILSESDVLILENMSLPLNLQSINWTAHPSLKVRLNLFTTDPLLTPVIDKVSIGSDLHLTKYTVNSEWSDGSEFGFNTDYASWHSRNNRWESSGSGSSFLGFTFAEHRPIKELQLNCICSGVYLSTGGQAQLISIPTTLTQTRNAGMGQVIVSLTINSNGWIESFDMRARYHGLANDSAIDVGDDGKHSDKGWEDGEPEWAWPYNTSHPISHHGMQSEIDHVDVSKNGLTTRHDVNSPSLSMVVENSTLNLSTYIPNDAEVISYQFTYTTTYLGTDANNSTYENEWDGLDLGQTGSQNQGINEWSMLMYGPQTNFTIPQVLEFQEFRHLFNFTGIWRLEVHRMMFTYDLIENISLDENDLADILAEQALIQNSTQVEIPVNFSTAGGGVHIGGAILWQYLITNTIVETPDAMVPDGTIYRTVTWHQHLRGQEFTSIELMLGQHKSTDSAEILMRIINPQSSEPSFEQPLGQGLIEWDYSNTTITQRDGGWEVEWYWSTLWLWDDRPQLHFMTEAHDVAGTELGPAIMTTGFSAGNAVENDLELVNIRVEDQFGREISDILDPEYPWPVAAGSNVYIEGQVRFEGSVDSWVPIAQTKVELFLKQGNFSTSTILEVGEQGAWNHSLNIPQADADLTHQIPMVLEAYLHQAGPDDIPEGLVEDSTTGIRGAEFIWDNGGPELGTLYAMTPSGDQPANGHVWNKNIPLALGLEVNDQSALGDELTLHYWREALDDDGDKIAQESEYGQLTVQLNKGVSEFIEFPFIDVDNSMQKSVISVYVSAEDLAGIEVNGGGAFGLENDLATIILMQDTPAEVVASDVEMQLHEDEFLLPGHKHVFSFVIEDENGLNSLDSVFFSLTEGEVDCVLEYRPWSIIPILWDEDCFQSEPIFEIVDEHPRYTVDIEFELKWSTIELLGDAKHIPSFRIEDLGTDLGLGLTNLEWLEWSLLTQLEVDVLSFVDLVPTSGTLLDESLFLAPGDIIDIEWGLKYAGTEIPAQNLPDGVSSSARILGGLSEMVVNANLSDNQSGLARFAFKSDDFPNNRGNLVIDFSGMGNYSIDDLELRIVLDDDAPRLSFHSTSMLRVRSDSLDGIQVSFSIIDDHGMKPGPLKLYWKFERNGLTLTGASGELQVDHISGEIYNDILNLSETLEGVELRGSDDLLVWVEGEDLSGNILTGPGSKTEPRRPSWDYIKFSPQVTYISVEPRVPSLGEIITIDVQVQNTGTLKGNTSVILIQAIDGQLTELEITEDFQLLPGLSAQFSFEYEIASFGDQQLYIGLEGEEGMSPIPLGIVRDSLIDDNAAGGEMKWILGSLVIIVCVFVVFMLIRSQLHSEDEEYEVEWEEEEEEVNPVLPSPKVKKIADIPPPRPPELDMIREEE